MQNRYIETAGTLYLNLKNEKVNGKPFVALHRSYRQNLVKYILRQKNAILAISLISQFDQFSRTFNP